MYSRFTLLKKFIRYYLSASNGQGHGIHSPFVFDLTRRVLNDHQQYYWYQSIEAVRKAMLEDHSEITVDDKGAGSAVTRSHRRKISEIARNSLKPRKYAQLLFRMVNAYQPKHILELGTSLGITTAYLAAANPAARVVSIEGSDAVSEKASVNLARLNLTNVQLVRGDFRDTLGPVLEQLKGVDLVFIDGNHRKAPTLEYLEKVLPYTHTGSILVFDDIHWSLEMEESWEAIRAHPAVTGTVDLFFLGLVFLRPEFKSRQHFVIRY
jgi:predicted O-methyltransferase YrrM